MKCIPTEVSGCFVVEMDRHFDDRGFFQEFYQEEKYSLMTFNGHEVYSLNRDWKQGNYSFSKKNVVRGIHVAPYAKLVTCVSGGILDVVVDFRKKSTTYLSYTSKFLSPSEPEQMFVPAGCGHGFMALKESVVIYLQDSVYKTNVEKSIRWDDPKINIEWPLANPDYIVSSKDESAPLFQEIIDELNF